VLIHDSPDFLFTSFNPQRFFDEPLISLSISTMRASHVALLSLAASTAAPVFAAPLPYIVIFMAVMTPLTLPILNSYFNARSKFGGVTLSARDSSDSRTEDRVESFESEARRDIPRQLTTRDAAEDFMNAIANVNARGSDVRQEEHARDSSDNSFGLTADQLAQLKSYSTHDLDNVMLNGRDLGPGQDIQARNFLSTLFEVGLNVLNQLRRDETSAQILAARNGADDFVNSLLNSRDTNPDDAFAKLLSALDSSRRDVATDELAARDSAKDFANSILLGSRGSDSSDTFADALSALVSSRRDVAPDGLAARSEWEDFVEMLNTRELGFKRDMHARGLFSSILSWGLKKLKSLSIHFRDLTPDELAGRDIVDDFLNTPVKLPGSSTQQETQPPRIPNGSTKTAAREVSSTDAFITALLNSRDPSKGDLTTDDVLSLASLASRALDELD
jgi:hypothetical protein